MCKLKGKEQNHYKVYKNNQTVPKYWGEFVLQDINIQTEGFGGGPVQNLNI